MTAQIVVMNIVIYVVSRPLCLIGEAHWINSLNAADILLNVSPLRGV